jgi:hypothetical protein
MDHIWVIVAFILKLVVAHFTIGDQWFSYSDDIKQPLIWMMTWGPPISRAPVAIWIQSHQTWALLFSKTGGL